MQLPDFLTDLVCILCPEDEKNWLRQGNIVQHIFFKGQIVLLAHQNIVGRADDFFSFLVQLFQSTVAGNQEV